MGNMIVMCGKCGSGKTTYAKKLLKFLPDYRYIGIDECYAILNGDESIRENKFDAWQLFFRRIYDCEVLGQNCIIDTNAPYVATVLELKRYAEQYIWWLVTDVIAVIMYCVQFDPVYLTKKSIYLIMAVIGLINWLKLNKRNTENT